MSHDERGGQRPAKQATRPAGNSAQRPTRRDLILAGGGALFLPAVLRTFDHRVPGVGTRIARSETGATLGGWTTVVGDGLWLGPGEAAVDDADIATVHHAGHSELLANVRRRHVMAHNITYRRIDDPNALRMVHRVAYDFRLPVLPSPGNHSQMGQSVEGGLAIWDGSATRLDYQVLFQWLVNPLWPERFGTLQTAVRDGAGAGWVPVGQLAPDTAWHRLEIVMDPTRGTCALAIDGASVPCALHGVQKPASWGPETSARLQAEIISVFPGADNTLRALHTAEFRNWSWTWEPMDCPVPGTPPAVPPAIPPTVTPTPLTARELYRWTWRGPGLVDGPISVPPAAADELLVFHGDLVESGRLRWHVFGPGVAPCRPLATSVCVSVRGGTAGARQTHAEEILAQVAAGEGISNWRALEVGRWCP